MGTFDWAEPTMKTLADIYNKITQGVTAGTHSLYPTTAPESTMHTLQEIYDAIPAGTTTASEADVLNCKTFMVRNSGK